MEARIDGFAPLASYAFLGDMRAAALVARDGAIDWLALPTIDSVPVCAALLDPQGGGSITLAPTVPFQVTRRYLPGTMVLETTFHTDSGRVRLTDALTLGALGTLPWTELVRAVEVEEGEVPLAWAVQPGHGLSASIRPWAHTLRETPVLLAGDLQLAVVTEGLGAPVVQEGRVSGEIVMRPGATGLLCVAGAEAEPVEAPDPAGIQQRLEHTADTWRYWSGLVPREGRWAELVLRSALVLKALTLKASGGIAAAATTSLPEQLGGERNFDYRFAWIRDGAFALDAMNRLGLTEEMHAGVSWMLAAVAQEAPRLRVFYDLQGRPVSSKMIQVESVPGYRGSRPVNIGNGAADQTQLGAYGDLLDAVWRYCQGGGRLSSESATMLAAIADHVCDVWPTPDAGLWELGSQQLYTSSKIGCWAALDRAVRLAEDEQIVHPHVPRWRAEREGIRDYINQRCWSESKQAYTFYADTDELDAAVLLMARMGFSEPGDRRLSQTIDAILRELGATRSLVYRYSGQQDKEGAFLACSCWLVEAMVHVGRVQEAEELFEEFVGHANDVGLLTEELDPSSGELRGNLPQALSHLALIGAATALTGQAG